MFRKKSREVIVTSVFEDGELHTEVAHTTDGEWHVGVNVVPRTVIAWMPLPEPYKGVTEPNWNPIAWSRIKVIEE